MNNGILDNIFVRILLAVLALFLAITTVKGIVTVYRDVVGNRVEKDTLTISATGEVKATPDVASANLSVLTEGTDPQRIQTQNTEKINAVIAFLKERGIADADIETRDFSLYPRYNYNEGQQQLDGYTITQSVNVKMRDLENVGSIIAGAVERGANTINSLIFEIEDPESLQQEARKLALESAKVKAQELAQVAGVKLGKVKSFSESSISIPTPYPVAYERDAVGLGGAAPSIEPGSTEVTATVSVTFELD